MNMGFESKEPVIKPCKSIDTNQIALGENEDSSDHGCSDNPLYNEHHQPCNRLTVGDEVSPSRSSPARISSDRITSEERSIKKAQEDE
jgi:hypothetical protein